MTNTDSSTRFSHFAYCLVYCISDKIGYLLNLYRLDTCLCPSPRKLNSPEQARAGRTVPHGRHGRIIVLDDSDQGTSRSGEVLTVFTGSPEHNSIRPALPRQS